MAVNSGHCVESEVQAGHWISELQEFTERSKANKPREGKQEAP